MKARSYFILIIVSMVFAITRAQADNTPVPAVTDATSHLQFGETLYPTSLYPSGTNSYFIIDKGGDNADASIVLRDQGNARAEIGLVEDNDFHIKTVTGVYGKEVFTDRLIIHAAGGQVDSFGTLLRQYANSGKPTIVVGNSDLSTGAGLELEYNHDKKQAGITSIDHGNSYRPLIIRSNGVQFFQGKDSVSPVASLLNNGLVKTPAIISGGTPFTVSGCAASAVAGGAAAGTFKSGTTGKCKAVITINGDSGLAAPHGWACSGNNLTSVHSIRQTASTTTTATLAGTTAANDVISFYCMGY